ncbi:hypothetical protein ACQKWADRAFT_283373 [Trichoderma austrokoningii]
MATFMKFRLVPAREEKVDENDDWYGLKDSKERRKRQNRINQRAARRRQRENLARELESAAATTTTAAAPSSPNAATTAAAWQCRGPSVSSTQVYFPLTPDHKLLYVTCLNVSRAIITNYFIMATIAPVTTSLCLGRRVFTIEDFTVAPRNLDGTLAVPPSFIPTKLQQEVAHPGWIDIFPSPQLRDNLILAVMEFNIDEDAILEDLIGDLFEAMGCGWDEESNAGLLDDAEANSMPFVVTPAVKEALKTYTPSSTPEVGILSWSDPWDISGWEVTERFCTRWGFLLQGCPDVVESANRWRALRGEDPLVVEI